MKHQKIVNLLSKENDSKFVIRKWNIFNDNSKENHDVGYKIIYNTEALKSNLRDCNNAYILVRSDITVRPALAAQVAFKNCATFTKCITKIDQKTIDDAEDLDLLMPMYNLIGYISNYSKTRRSLWFYSKEEATDFGADIANDNNFNLLNIRLSY